MSGSGVYPIGFCALAYRAHEGGAFLNILNVILVVNRLGNEELCIRVRPDWCETVGREALPHLQALFDDFKERVKYDPQGLLKQLSELSVGGLVTYETGRDLAERPDLYQLFESFAEI